jgi:DNA-binding HxlR family transcriptional regulator
MSEPGARRVFLAPHPESSSTVSVTETNRHHGCEFRDMLSRVGDKWSLLVIFGIDAMPSHRGRFSDLKRSIPGISQRMLTATVRNLERDGMLTRYVYAEVPPRVEYELTPLGRGLMEPVRGLVSWLQSNGSAIRSARELFDARKNLIRTSALSGSSAVEARIGEARESAARVRH